MLSPSWTLLHWLEYFECLGSPRITGLAELISAVTGLIWSSGNIYQVRWGAHGIKWLILWSSSWDIFWDGVEYTSVEWRFAYYHFYLQYVWWKLFYNCNTNYCSICHYNTGHNHSNDCCVYGNKCYFSLAIWLVYRCINQWNIINYNWFKYHVCMLIYSPYCKCWIYIT